MAKGRGWTQQDWYVEGESQIHFFPFPKRLLWTVGKKIMLDVEAWGGVKRVPHHHFDGDKVDSGVWPNPTTPGIYVISGWGPYRTERHWVLSRIPWGTELRLDSTGKHLLYKTGSMSQPWRPLESIIPVATLDFVRDSFSYMWGRNRRYDRNGDGIPDVWVFNDFGPIAINYFRDTNRNRKQDPGEDTMGEKIHTTPKNEGQTDQGTPVPLFPSHGCIHVRPADFARLLKQGAFKVGELVVVHGPNEVVWEELSR
jgi:hypothetical protein